MSTRVIATVLSSLGLLYTSLFSHGIATYHDSSAMHSVRGMDHTTVPPRRSRMKFNILPYYQHAKRARDTNGDFVELGDRLGYINMLALLIGDGPSPYEASLKFNADPAPSDDTSALHQAYNKLKAHAAANADDAIYFAPTYDPQPASKVPQYGYGKYRSTIKYNRIGLRGGFDYSFDNGIGVSINAGCAEYSIKPSMLGNPNEDTTVVPSVWSDSAVSSSDALLGVIHDNLTSQARRQAVGKDLGVDFSGRTATGMEDTIVSVYWRKGYSMKDAEGDKVVTAIPYFSLAVTLPTAERKVASRLFDISLGNDGFYGFTGHAEVSFDFPGMVKVGMGAAVTLFNDDSIGKQFVPTSEHQATLYPWQTTVTKRPGALWKAFATLTAPHFVDYLSCYMSYILTAHEADTITVSGLNKTLFLHEKLGEDGQYNSHAAHIGFEYEVTPALRFGGGLQAVFGGKKIWQTTTVGGSLSFVF